ncbi:phosphate ABC transporter permease subunit PstC [Halobacteriales archaeon QS_8_69_26]|nr:MAG: phosphate ABC transporter permease subunit PstC [Halobacteriales archaeon QS_8_69_26]
MATDTGPPDLTGDRDLGSARERTYHVLLFVCAALSVLVTLAILGTLLGDAVAFFRAVSPVEFFTRTTWAPSIKGVYGVWPLVYATVAVTVGSAALALPIGVLTAIYLSEYASESTRAVLKPLLEVLAGVPTVVYGYFALVYITPALRIVFPEISTFNILSGSIVVGIMIVPMVSSISEDAMNAVPDSLRQAGYGLGATKFEVSTGVVVPAAISGIASSFILALSRAIGETMAVTLAVGMQTRFPSAFTLQELLLRPGQTMTAAIVNIGLSDVTGGSTTYRSLFAIGLTLFVITLAMNVVSDLVAERYREEYE